MMTQKKIALVTGAAGSIGLQTVKEFLSQGFAVIMQDKEKIDFKDQNAIELNFDLQKYTEDENFANTVNEKIHSIVGDNFLKALVNNAAVQILGNTTSLNRTNWQQSLNVNLIAPFLLSQSLLKLLTEADGSIVNVGSIHSDQTKPNFLCYSTSKAALASLTKGMAVELGGDIRVNNILPGAINTDMLRKGFEENPELLKLLNDYSPQGRIGSPIEIAKLVAFLCSDDASLINGASIQVDGGISSRLYDPI